MYPIISVPDDAPDNPEQLGTKMKFWFVDDTTGPTLFKAGRPGTGENWAEKVCAEICALLEIPHAHYELARWKGHDGVVSPSFIPSRGRLILGNELLAKVVPDYPHTERYKARQHSVRIVLSILRQPSVDLPGGYTPPDWIGGPDDLFVGYLLLDALVGNQDRHHENWGVILDRSSELRLTPTFDHASSLGRNERDEIRRERLTTRDRGRSVEHYARRATSALFQSASSTRPLSTIDAFSEAAKHSSSGALPWLSRLEQTTMSDYQRLFDLLPQEVISETAAQFALRMIEVNRTRLLELS